MPIVNVDGKNVFIEEGTPNPEAAARRKLKKLAGGESFLGDIGRGIGAGLVGIPQGITTLGSTIVDGIFDTNLTRKLNNYFEKFKPETNSTAGHVAQYMVQFGLPGLGVASAVSKAGKSVAMLRREQMLAAGAVDAAVATDDVETLSDLIFDDVSDEERLSAIEGSEAAASRLLDRAAVFGETAALIGGLPIALKGLAKTGRATAEVAGMAASPLVKAVASSPTTNAIVNRFLPSTSENYVPIQEAVDGTSNKLMDRVIEKFTFQGALKSDDVAQLKEASTQETRRQLTQTSNDFESIMSVLERAGTSGNLSRSDQETIAKAIGDYYSPLTRISYGNKEIYSDPVLRNAKAKEIQKEALAKIKSFEGDRINYEELGIPEGGKLSTLLEQQRDMVDINTNQINSLKQEFIPEELGNILDANFGLYTNRSYKAMLDPNFIVDETKKEAAIKALERSIAGASDLKVVTQQQIRTEAETAFNNFLKYKKFDAYQFENINPAIDVFSGAIRKDILKGRTLDSLPEVREALGEIAGYLETNWKDSLNNTRLQAFQTIKKQANLVGKSKMLQDIKKLNDGAETFNVKPFIFDEIDVTGTANQFKPGEEFVNSAGVKFKKFDDKAGPLAGKVASKRFHDALLDATTNWTDNLPELIGAPYKALVLGKSTAQYAVTVLSPSAQIRNPTGGGIMTFAAGNLGSGGGFVNALGKVFNRFNKDPNKQKFEEGKIVDRSAGVTRENQIQEVDTDFIKSQTIKFKRLGVNDQSATAQAREIEEAAKFASTSNQIGKFTESGPIRALRESEANKAAQFFYTGTDNVLRSYNFIKERDDLFKALIKHGDADIPITSVKNKFALDNLKLRNQAVNGNDILGETTVKQIREYYKKNPITQGRIEEFLDAAVKGKLKGIDAVPKTKAKAFMDLIDEEAAQLAKNHYQNYNRTGAIIGDLAKLPIGTFAAFPSEVIRTMGNIGYRAAQELASNNPELRRKGMKRAVSALTVTTAFPAAVTELGLQLTGSDREQLDAYKRSFAAPWDKTATLVPVATDDNGKIKEMINLSYTNPYDYLSRPFARLIAEAEEGEDKGEGIVNRYTQGFMYAVGEVGKPFGTPSMSTQLLVDIVKGETETGKKLYAANDTFGDRATKGFVHTIQGMAPPVVPFDVVSDPGGGVLGVGLQVKDFPTAVFHSTGLAGDQRLKTSRGTKIDPAEALVQGFSGLKVIKPQVARTLRYRGFETNEITRAAANEFNRVARSTNVRDAETFIKSYIQSNEDRFRGMRDLYLAIEDARRLGLGDQEILKELKTAKVANADYVMAGLFKPSQLSEEVISEAYREEYNKARNFLPIVEIGATELALQGQQLTGGFRSPQEIYNRPNVPTRTPTVAPQPSALRQQEFNKLLGID